MTNTLLRPISAFALLVAVSGVAHAAPVFTVNDTRDLPDLSPGDGVCRINTPPAPAKCTLRAAVQEANAAFGVATITVPYGTYNLTSLDADGDRDLDVTKSMTIAAAAQASVVVQVGTNGDRPNRVFDVHSGTLTLQGITAANSRPGPGYEGGCMRVANGAGLTLDNSQVINCVTSNSDGGGIHNSGMLTLLAGATLSSNRTYTTGSPAAGRGGAVFNASTGAVHATGTSFVVANHADKGGGIYNGAGLLTANGATMVFNSAQQGGAIFSTGTTYLGTTSVQQNSATDGGGVYQFGSGLSISGSSLLSNAATAQGGAIYLAGEPTDSASVSSTSFSSDHATGSGGGVFSEAPTLFLLRTSFTGEASDHEGGAIATNGDVECISECSFVDNRCYAPSTLVTSGLCGAAVYTAGTAQMFAAKFSGNRSGVLAHADGGAIAAEQVKLTECTFDNNSTLGAGGALYVMRGGYIENSTFWQNESTGSDGGAIAAHSSGSTLSIYSSTFLENYAVSFGATIHGTAGVVALANTAIVDGAGDNSIFCDTGSVDSHGYNFLTGIGSSCTITGSVATDTFGDNSSAKLGSLADNGGYTKTIAMAGDSALIDAGDPTGCAAGAGGLLLNDQRELFLVIRHADGNGDGVGRCDIGAYEFGASAGYVAFSSAATSVNEGAGAVTLRVRRYADSPTLLGAVTVSCGPIAGTATATDYSTATATLSWASGDDTEQTFAIAITDDTLHESSETFTVACTVTSGAGEVGAPHTVTIVDND